MKKNTLSAAACSVIFLPGPNDMFPSLLTLGWDVRRKTGIHSKSTAVLQNVLYELEEAQDTLDINFNAKLTKGGNKLSRYMH